MLEYSKHLLVYFYKVENVPKMLRSSGYLAKDISLMVSLLLGEYFLTGIQERFIISFRKNNYLKNHKKIIISKKAFVAWSKNFL